MSGRRRRGRHRPWEPRDGSSTSGQSRHGADGPSSGGSPPRGAGGYMSGSLASRWQGGTGPGGRRPDGGAYGRTRWTNGNGGPQGSGQRRYGGGQPQQPRWGRGNNDRPYRPSPSADRRAEPPPSVPPGGDIDPFELFCAYHLGITADGTYRIQNIHEVARRFGTNAAALRQTLTAYGMDAEDLVHSGFDLASAQIDIMVAPEGISRRELARPLFDEFKSAPRKVRDWAKEMEEADRQIERTIGSDGRWSPPPRDRSGKQT